MFVLSGTADRVITYIRCQQFSFPEERIDDLPGGQDGDVDGQQHSDHHEQLVILDGLFDKLVKVKYTMKIRLKYSSGKFGHCVIKSPRWDL